MSDQDGFDARLSAHFEREHRVLPDDAFTSTALRRIRVERRRKDVTRTSQRIAAFAAVAAASPWLISGVVHMNAALEASLVWVTSLPGVWVPGALVILVLLAARVLRR